MFILNTEIQVNWLLPASNDIKLFSDFDVIVRKPDGSSTYNESAIAETDYIPPSVNSAGGVTYRLTPDTKGVWLVVLTIGTAGDADIYYEYYLQVHQNDTHIYQQVNLG